MEQRFFNRTAYKQSARAELKGRWKMPALLCLACAVLTALLMAVLCMAIFGSPRLAISFFVQNARRFTLKIDQVSLSVGISLFEPLVVAFCWNLCTARNISFSQAFGNAVRAYPKTFLFMLWKMLRIFLWMLLLFPFVLVLVIFGWNSSPYATFAAWIFIMVIFVWKSIDYSQGMFAVLETPNKDFSSVASSLEVSIDMVDGYRLDFLFLELSFVPWAILATVTLGIGWLFLIPYKIVTRIFAYRFLRARYVEFLQRLSEIKPQ